MLEPGGLATRGEISDSHFTKMMWLAIADLRGFMSSDPNARTVFGIDRWTVWPTVVIALIVVTLGAVLPAVNHAVSPDETIEPGAVLDVGVGVSFTPVSGWLLNTDATRPGGPGIPGIVEVSETGVLLAVSAEPFDGTLEEFMDSATDKRSAAVDNVHLSSPQQSAVTAQGATGLTETYNGIGVQGSLTVFVSDGVAVTIDADGPEGSAARHADEIAAMTRTIVFAEHGLAQ
jgi:hypothetical protein